jgi:Rad3-related DNA helicases
MSEADRQTFLAQFQEHPTQTLVGFALLGGIFSEGIDLKADRLIGVGIVSVGLPGINPETDLIRDYFDSQGNPASPSPTSCPVSTTSFRPRDA